jgi:hypothetical protein
MVGTTLVDIRDHIEALASPDGEYYLVCARTGDRPVPAAGLRFETRQTARNAARATEQYRAALREYDPRLPYYDVVVSQANGAGASTPTTGSRSRDGVPATPGRVFDDAAASHRDLVEFCHRVAAAVFETLSDGGYDDVETAVMDAYFDHAETVADPDELCLCLLESMAAELDAGLSPAEQAAVIETAATRLPPTESASRPVSATFDHLQDRGLVGGYVRSPWSVDLAEGTRSVVVRVSEYALSPRGGRLPVLPIALALSRRQADWHPSSLRVADAEDGWRLTVVLAREAEPQGLASAPIQGEGP